MGGEEVEAAGGTEGAEGRGDAEPFRMERGCDWGDGPREVGPISVFALGWSSVEGGLRSEEVLACAPRCSVPGAPCAATGRRFLGSADRAEVEASENGAEGYGDAVKEEEEPTPIA